MMQNLRRREFLRADLITLGVLLGVLAGTASAQFTSQNATLLSHLDLAAFAGGDGNANDCWGYVSPSGREYALVGLERALAVVEITDPQNPVIVARIAHTASLWADVKVFDHYCYVVNESGGGLQVVDLGQVDSGVVSLVNTITSGGLSTSHNIVVNADSGFLYTVSANVNAGLDAYDLSNPASPVLAGCWTDASVHDAAVFSYTSGPFSGREIAFCFDGGSGLDVVDVTNKSNMVLLSRTAYPGLQFTHQGWPSPDMHYLYVDDELDEQRGTTPTTRTLIFDISDLTGPVLVGTATTGLPAIDHNLYTLGTLVFEANYTSGLRVFSAADPVNLVEVAFFDTYPEGDSASFNGAWNVFPYFPSGNVIISDLNRGLFVVSVAPRLPQIDFVFPNGLPEFLDPTGDTIRVELTGMNGGGPQAGSGMLHFDAGAGLVSVPMNEVSPNVYDAVFPSLNCGADVAYYFSAVAQDGQTETSPSNAPIDTFAALIANGDNVTQTDDVESDLGWVVNPSGGDDATTGIWTRVDPLGTGAQPEDDHTPDPGTICWVTGQGSVGGGLGENDVDGGSTTLMSPPLDASGLADPRISYWRWYSNNAGAAPGADIFVVDVSNNDGATWTNVEVVGPGGDGTSGGWILHEFNVADLIVPTSQMRLRFTASDLDAGSIIEAAIDDLRVRELVCGGTCAGDLNGDGQVALDDLATLLANFGAASGAAPEDGDLDGDGDVDLADLATLLSVFGTPCP